ncbi:hypothetical protein D3C87_1325700 [compost metagenome]
MVEQVRALSVNAYASALAQRPEARADFFRERPGLFPRREVAALGQAVEVNQLRVGTLRPASWRGVDLVGEHTHGNRNGDVLRREKVELVLPIQPR